MDVNVSGRIRRNFVNKVRQDKTVVIAVMHNIEEIIEIADYVLAIPNMPYSSKEIPSHAKVEYLKNNNPNKGKKFEENNFVSIARNILESSSL